MTWRGATVTDLMGVASVLVEERRQEQDEAAQDRAAVVELIKANLLMETLLSDAWRVSRAQVRDVIAARLGEVAE